MDSPFRAPLHRVVARSLPKTKKTLRSMCEAERRFIEEGGAFEAGDCLEAALFFECVCAVLLKVLKEKKNKGGTSMEEKGGGVLSALLALEVKKWGKVPKALRNSWQLPLCPALQMGGWVFYDEGVSCVRVRTHQHTPKKGSGKRGSLWGSFLSC
jgi:hypothetical protein